jgi:hypothetical protein
VASVRVLSYAGSDVAVSWAGEDAGGVAAFLFGGFPPARRDAAPASRIDALPGPEPGTHALRRDGAPLWDGDDVGALAEVWLGAVSHDLAYHSRGGLLLHAGSLATPAGGLLLPGAVASGKTTLTLWLATRGAGYRTDELAFVPDGANAVAPCPRPLNLKRPSLAPLRGVFDPATAGAAAIEGPLGFLVAPEAVSPGEPAGLLETAIAVFPRYEAGAPGELAPLSKAEGAVALMECLVNARNLPGHGLREAARLAAALRCWRLRYSAFDQLGPLLEILGLAR